MSLHQAAERLGVHYMTAYRYVRTGRLPATRDGAEWRVDPSDVERLRSGAGVAPRRGSRGDATRRLELRMLAGDTAGAWAVVEATLASGASPSEIYLGLLGPALVAIGTRWATGELTVADEHRATVCAQRLIGQLGPRFATRGRTRGTIVLGAPAGERHGLPSAMLADLLRAARFTALDLGADTPPDSFVDAARAADRLVAVCIGVTGRSLDTAVRKTLRALRDADVAVPIVVGGAGITDAAHAARLGADAWSGPDVVATIESLAGSPTETRDRGASP